MRKIALILLVVIIAFASCTVEKRHYRRGFYVDVHRKNSSSPTHDGKAPAFAKEAEPELAETHPEDNATDALLIHDSSVTIFSPTPVTIHRDPSDLPVANSIDPALKQNPDKHTSIAIQEESHVMLSILATLLAFGAITLLLKYRKPVMRITRWAKANPRMTIAIITVMKLLLLFTGLVIGNGLHKAGHSIAEFMYPLFGTMSLVGFLTTPFLFDRTKQRTEKELNRYRIGYLAIALGSFMSMVSLGNHLEEKHSKSAINSIVQHVDQSLFGTADSDIPNPVTEKVTRAAGLGGLYFGTIMLIFLLCILICAGLCCIILGFALLSDGDMLGILGIFIGPFIIWLGIIGWKATMRRFRSRKEQLTK